MWSLLDVFFNFSTIDILVPVFLCFCFSLFSVFLTSFRSPLPPLSLPFPDIPHSGLFMFISMGILGCLGMAYAVVSLDGKTVLIDDAGAGWLCIVAIYVYVFGFAWSWGPVCWLYPTEVLPTNQRAKGVALTTASNFAFNVLIAQFTPILRHQMRFKMFLMFSGSCLGFVVFVYFMIPESRGKSLEQLGKAFRADASVDGHDDDEEGVLHDVGGKLKGGLDQSLL